MKRKNYLRQAVILSVMTFFATAAQAVSYYASGSGTPGDPYVITTPAELDSVRANLDANFILGNDIDLTDYFEVSDTTGWRPIGNSTTKFTGVFDGGGHFITNFWYYCPTIESGGLFGVASNDTIKNLGVILSTKSISAKTNEAAILGSSNGGTLIEKCCVIGDISASGKSAVGSILGYISGSTTLNKCYAVGTTVKAESNGGLIGSIYANRTYFTVNVNECYSAQKLLSNKSASPICAYVAFKFGWVPAAGTIYLNVTNSVVAGDSITSVTKPGEVGRLAGYVKDIIYTSFNNNYGYDAMIVNTAPCTTGTTTNVNGLNKTAAELKTQSTYESLGWDFTTTWTMGNDAYQLPVLKDLSLTNQPTTAVAHLTEVITDLTTGKVADIQVNLSSNLLTINGKKANSVVIVYDCLGHTIINSCNTQIDFSSYANGIYFVKVEGITTKVMKN